MFAQRHIKTVLVGILVIIIAGAGAYWIKSQALAKQQRLEAITSQIASEKDRIIVLEADWAYLTQPTRIHRLAQEMLSFAPIVPWQILHLDSLGYTPAEDIITATDTIPDGGITPSLTPISTTAPPLGGRVSE